MNAMNRPMPTVIAAFSGWGIARKIAVRGAGGSQQHDDDAVDDHQPHGLDPGDVADDGDREERVDPQSRGEREGHLGDEAEQDGDDTGSEAGGCADLRTVEGEVLDVGDATEDQRVEDHDVGHRDEGDEPSSQFPRDRGAAFGDLEEAIESAELHLGFGGVRVFADGGGLRHRCSLLLEQCCAIGSRWFVAACGSVLRAAGESCPLGERLDALRGRHEFLGDGHDFPVTGVTFEVAVEEGVVEAGVGGVVAVRGEIHTVDSRPQGRGQAHRAGLAAGVQHGSAEVERAQALAGVADRLHLGVGRGVEVCRDAVDTFEA